MKVLVFMMLITAINLVGCVKSSYTGELATDSSGGPTPTPDPQGEISQPVVVAGSFSNCVDAGKNEAACALEADHYYYTVPYGGRLDAPAITGPVANQMEFTIPDGWQSGANSITFTSTLAASDIRAGTTILGVTGSYGTTVSNVCAETFNSTCLISAGDYLYNSPYGGRSANCTWTQGSQLSDCWLGSAKKFYLTTTAPTNSTDCVESAYATANHSGLAARCKVPDEKAGSFVYANRYGGRDSACDAPTPSASYRNDCWLTLDVGQAVMVGPASSGVCPEHATSPCKLSGDVELGAGISPYKFVSKEEYGGRKAVCSFDAAGSCWVAKDYKTDIEINLNADLIKSKITIFGVVGKFIGEGAWKSGAHRTIGTYPLALNDEASAYSGEQDQTSYYGGLPDGYRETPYSSLDDEGTSGENIAKVERGGWGSTTCGTTGTIKERIKNCTDTFGIAAVWDGANQGNGGQGKWSLVTRSGGLNSSKGQEVWLDANTGMLWSSLIGVSINWCKATGSTHTADGICNNATYQNQTAGAAVAACREANFATDSSIDIRGKAGLGTASTPTVEWRLPTLYDYEVGEYNGIRFVLPEMGPNLTVGQGVFEWTATFVSGDTTKAWTIGSRLGLQSQGTRSINGGVRCIGRANIKE